MSVDRLNPARLAYPHMYEQPGFATAMEVQDDVHKALIYSPVSVIRGMSSVEALNRNLTRQVDCLGYTVLGSRRLERAGVDHFVAFVNGHSTNMVPFQTPEGETQLWLVDMLGRRLTQDVTAAVNHSGTGVDHLKETTRAEGRALMTLDSRKIGSKTGWAAEQLMAAYPWLSVKDALHKPRTLLKVSLFEPSQGRDVLASYSRFKYAVAQNDLEAARDSVLEMNASFPDIDIRGRSPKIIRSIAKKLTIAGQPDSAVDVTNAFFDSFAPSEDTRVWEYRADCLRSIAKTMKSSGRFSDRIQQKLVGEARDMYRRIAGDKRAHSSAIAKLAICESILSEG